MTESNLGPKRNQDGAGCCARVKIVIICKNTGTLASLFSLVVCSWMSASFNCLSIRCPFEIAFEEDKTLKAWIRSDLVAGKIKRLILVCAAILSLWRQKKKLFLELRILRKFVVVWSKPCLHTVGQCLGYKRVDWGECYCMFKLLKVP